MPGSNVVRLYRDSLTTPWGFRLQGGKDLKQALTVLKVTVGTPAFGELHPGDELIEIQNCDATRMSHNKAQEMIKNAGGSLLLRIHRLNFYPQSPPPPQELQIAAHVGKTHQNPQGGFMMHRLQDTLTGIIMGQTPADRFQNNINSYNQTLPRGAGNKRGPQNNSTSQGYNSPSYAPTNTSHVSKPWRPPSSSHVVHPALPSGLAEPGWAPKALKTTHAHQRPSSVQPQYQSNNASRPHQLPSNERPPWEGSLRSSVPHHFSDNRPEVTQIAHYTPSSAPGSLTPSSQDGYCAANLQYNSPMGLYSKQAINEAMTGQLGPGAAGQPLSRDSDVYRMVHADGRGSRPSSDNYVAQSPSMVALEAQYVRPESSFYSDY